MRDACATMVVTDFPFARKWNLSARNSVSVDFRRYCGSKREASRHYLDRLCINQGCTGNIVRRIVEEYEDDGGHGRRLGLSARVT